MVSCSHMTDDNFSSKKDNRPPRRQLSITAGVALVLLLLAGLAALYFLWLAPPPRVNGSMPSATVTDRTKPTGTGVGAPIGGHFAAYSDVPVKFNLNPATYALPLDPSAVTNAASFTLSDAAWNLIRQNGFVVVPAEYREFHPLYEDNSYQKVPSFVTVDSVLHSYHLIFGKLQEKLETQKLAGLAGGLAQEMAMISDRQLAGLAGTEWENAARRNLAFFYVGAMLSDPNFHLPTTVPSSVRGAVTAELKLIEAHQGVNPSPVMNIGQSAGQSDAAAQASAASTAYTEDYSQYQPSGHYDKTVLLRRYFQTMTWFGRMTFRFSQEDEVRSAALISMALDDQERRDKWDTVYSPTAYFVGASDDVSVPVMAIAVRAAYGANPTAADLAGSDKFSRLKSEMAKMKPPAANALVVREEDVQRYREAAVRGFRFMGQRFSLDAAVFQRLVYPAVKENAQGGKRLLPMALDIPAVFGSDEARKLLQAAGQADYQGYAANLEKLTGQIAGIEKDTWTSNLYFAWLDTLRPLLGARTGWPAFMATEAWARKSLVSYIGSWTELNHDTVLYPKQVYAAQGSEATDKGDWYRGYVEPEPWLYARLQALVQMTSAGLEARGLSDSGDSRTLTVLSDLVAKFKDISQKELSGQALSEEDYTLIRSYGGQLEHIWVNINTSADSSTGYGTADFLNNNPVAVVTDMATDPSGGILEEGTGDVWSIYVVVPIEGKLRLTRGAVYSYCEFRQPLDKERLTDTAWREMIDSGRQPPSPAWTGVYLAQ